MVENDQMQARVEKGGTPRPPTTTPLEPGKLMEIIADLTKIMKEAIRVRRGSQDLVEIEIEKIERVTRELRRVAEATPDQTPDATIQNILKNTEDIKKKLSIIETQGPKTWSQVAAGRIAQPAITA